MSPVSRAIRQEITVKYILIGKEDIKLSLFAHNMALYVEKLTLKKLLEQINEFSTTPRKSTYKNQ